MPVFSFKKSKLIGNKEFKKKKSLLTYYEKTNMFCTICTHMLIYQYVYIYRDDVNIYIVYLNIFLIYYVL